MRGGGGGKATKPTGPAPDINDKYAGAIYRGLTNFGSEPRAGAPELDVKGETENHGAERVVGVYLLSPATARPSILAWYGPRMLQNGDQAGEGVFPASHQSHYSGPLSAGLWGGMKAGHDDVVDLMTGAWRSDFAKFALLADPGLTAYASPCARLLDGADQRSQLAATIAWLLGRKIHWPLTLRTAPDWLGLDCLTRIQDAHDRGEEWARRWPEIRKSIVAGTRADILPVKFAVAVEKSTKGHVAYFLDPSHIKKNGAKWALMEYGKPLLIRYGVDDPSAKNGLKGAVLEPASPRPECPGGATDRFTLPVASGKWVPR